MNDENKDLDTLEQDSSNIDDENTSTDTETLDTDTGIEEDDLSFLDGLTDDEFRAKFNKKELPFQGNSKQTKKENKSTDTLPEQNSDNETDTDKNDNDNVSQDIDKPSNAKDEDKSQSKGKLDDQPNTPNYKEIYDQIFKPFKANGKEIAPKSVEDIVQLMQMGSNYAKKMTAIKPMRKVAQSLETAGISEEDLNFLIDVHKGNPEAVKELMKKHKLDPIEMDLENVQYKPNRNIVSDASVAFGEALEDIKESPYYDKVRDVLFNRWDDRSKNEILSNHGLMKGLHAEFESGRFDEIQKIVEYERVMGRMNGLSDMEAYVKVQETVNTQHKNDVKPKENKPTEKSKNVIDPSVNKNGAKVFKGKVPAQQLKLTPEDMLSMSDEEFEKLKSMQKKKLF